MQFNVCISGYGYVCTEYLYGMKKYIATLIHHCSENDNDSIKFSTKKILFQSLITTFINLCEN